MLMEIENQYRHRGKDILSLLLKHGPLSFSAMSQMLIPQMKKKSIKKSLQKLRSKGFIASRVVGDTKTFYQISQGRENRIKTAKFLNCNPDLLLQPHFRHQNWIHTECCEYWISHLSRLFPHAEVIRDSNFSNNVVAQRVMLISKNDFELRPDFLLFFPKTEQTESVSIAVEIERSRKSNRRLVAKLTKYANKSFIDGLIYVCDSEGLRETIRLLYKNKIVEKAHRIKHYTDNFFLFSDVINTHQDPLSKIFNSEKKPTSIPLWISYLKTTKRNFRRDQSFPMMGSPTPSILS